MTTAGEAFLREAREILSAVDRAPRAARAIASGQEGIVRIGFTAAAGFSVLGPLLTAISTALPRLDIDLTEAVTRDQTLGLSEGTLDLGLARPPFDTSRFSSRLIHTEDLVLAVPSGHRLADDPSPRPDWSREGLIMHSPTTAAYFHDLTRRVMDVDSMRIAHTVSQVTTMIALVRAGRGIAAVPASAAVLCDESIAFRPLSPAARGAVELHALWSPTQRNPALKRVLQVMANLDHDSLSASTDAT